MADGETVREASYEELGVRLPEPVPAGFAPTEADDDELSRYGYPDRPDPQRYPKHYEHWKRMVSSSSARIEPVFGVFSGPSIGPNLPLPPHPGGSTNWSGSVAYPQGDLAFRTVAGRWTVPSISQGFGPGVSICATWVGLDGWFEADPNNVTRLFQAGTTQRIDQWFAWVEWLPNNPVIIRNLPVTVGEVVFCSLTRFSETEGLVFMRNESTQHDVVFRTISPSLSKVYGTTAEWIVELPGSPDGTQAVLGNFGSVTFDSCIAFGRTLDGSPVEASFPGLGELLTMLDPDQAFMPNAVPTVLDADSIRIDWVDPQERF
jgi:hypothetical protein